MWNAARNLDRDVAKYDFPLGKPGPSLMLLLWIVAAGAFYSTGTIFLALDRRVPYFHAVWHMFVVAGSICHYVGVLVYVALR